MLTVEQRVQRGIAYCDLFGPENWREMIDLDTLDIASGQLCIAGQVFGGYWKLPNDLDTADYGFSWDEEEDVSHINALEEWYESDQIGERPRWDVKLHAEWIRVLSA